MIFCEKCIHQKGCGKMLNCNRYEGELERPHGEWREVDIKPLPYGGYTCNYQCNNNKCNYFTKEYHLNFCPNCGASMISSNSEIEKPKSKICPCIECCKIDNSEPCRKGCSEYQKWKEGGEK